MGAFFFIASLLISVLVAYLIYRKNSKLIADDEKFQQYGVTVFYHTGKVVIGKYEFDVNSITGIGSVQQTSHRRTDHSVEIEVDSIAKPVHRIVMAGYGNGYNKANDFKQRLCVAIRKAGGPNFI